MSTVSNTKKIYFFWLYFSVRGCFALRFMSTAKNTKKNSKKVLLSDLLFLVVFFCSRMFCSQIHEHDKEHQKVSNTKKIYFFWLYFSVRGCFALRFMSTAKNTKKNSKKYFFVGWMFCNQIHKHSEEHKKRFCYQIYFSWLYFSVRGCFALRFMSTTKNTKKNTKRSFSVGWMFCSQIHKHSEEHKIRFCYQIYFSWLYFSVRGCFALRFMSTAKNTKKIHEHGEEYQKDILFLVVFFCSRMFCSQIHEHGKEHQKVSIIPGHFKNLYKVSSIRFMNTMKNNTKKILKHIENTQKTCNVFWKDEYGGCLRRMREPKDVC
ncbi:hypothetical protein DEO72_LG8g2103 [Vigna unguiculata]|uniref:Uncharacterized protein n=1 Tax=Vigna unguiculata TaxID=3917 RepID=A0A4D6MRC6_VIGUN|nr:hypothetical protein DEO72_LG8g2103 [Vigna unguiculata]